MVIHLEKKYKQVQLFYKVQLINAIKEACLICELFGRSLQLLKCNYL